MIFSCQMVSGKFEFSNNESKITIIGNCVQARSSKKYVCTAKLSSKGSLSNAFLC